MINPIWTEDATRLKKCDDWLVEKAMEDKIKKITQKKEEENDTENEEKQFQAKGCTMQELFLSRGVDEFEEV